MGNYNLEDAQQHGIILKYRLFPSTRASLAIVGFLGSIVLYLMRVNMSVAIICMTIDETDGNSSLYTTESPGLNQPWHRKSFMWTYLEDNWKHRKSLASQEEGECPGEDGGDDDSENTGEFYWDRELRGTINSSFFWGYVLTQVFGGMMAAKFGSKWVIGIGVSIQIVLTFVSPAAARVSPYALMLVRFIEGLGTGVYYPCFHHMWAVWAPIEERSLLTTLVLCGTSWGSLVSFALSGVLCAELGWEWVFWIYGVMGAIWSVLWVIFVYDPPEVHPRITLQELNYIQQSKDGQNNNIEKMKTPWLKILTDPCVVCLYVTMFCTAWGGYTNLTSLPQYMKDVLKLDIKKNGFYSSLPHLCKFIMSIILAIIADKLIAKKILSVIYTRKLMESLGTLIPAMLLLAVTYLDCYSTGLVIVCLTFAEGFAAGDRAGALTNIVEIAPRYAGIIMGFGNAIANCAGIFAPIAVGKMTPDGTQEQWRNVFFLSVGLYIVAWLSFITFSKGHVQTWALPPNKDNVQQQVYIVDVKEKEEASCKKEEWSQVTSKSEDQPKEIFKMLEIN